MEFPNNIRQLQNQDNARYYLITILNSLFSLLGKFSQINITLVQNSTINTGCDDIHIGHSRPLYGYMFTSPLLILYISVCSVQSGDQGGNS